MRSTVAQFAGLFALVEIFSCSSDTTNQQSQATGGAAAAPATGGVAKP